LDHGSISAATAGNGNAGNLTIQSGSTVVMKNSEMTTEALHASGGQIEITAPEMVRLIDSTISTSVAGSTVDTAGGNITIDPQFVILQNSQIFSQSHAGAGGAVLVTAGFFLMDPASVLAASSQIGVLVEFESPLSKVTAHLSQQFSSAAALLLAQRCAADSTGQFSSFVQTGRDGVPQVPGALSPSPLSFLEPLTSGSWGSPSPNWAAARLGLDAVRVDDSTRFHSACRS
jgi:large exoprotein involved in heme utilization and adhesion